MLIFETQEIGCDFSLMKISYKLRKKTTKTEKFEKHLKVYIINFKTKSYELTASGNIINSTLNYKLKRVVSNLRLPKKQKQAKIAISRKKRARKVSKALKNKLFPKNFSMLKYF